MPADKAKDRNSAPFFSIGVTTHNRPALLQQTIHSIKAQTFSDFEVIVGNDYTAEPLSLGDLGINDTRVRVVNHPQNMGEIRNMNSLLHLARGRYFTWLSDDDLYDPEFLAKVYSALVKFSFPVCTYTSFEYVEDELSHESRQYKSKPAQLLSGREFLGMYWSAKLKAMGCTGVFDAEYLREIGGVEYMADTSFALYSEHLLLVRTGLLEQVAYIDEPLVKYRIHERSWGCTSKDLALNRQAGKNLVNESARILADPKLKDDFRQNIASLLKFVVVEFFSKLRAQDSCFSRLKAIPHLLLLRKQFQTLKGSSLYWDAQISWGYISATLIWWLCTRFNVRAMLKTE